MPDEVILPDFDYVSNTPIQRSIIASTKELVLPFNKIQRENDIIFNFPSSTAFTALHETKLSVEVKVTKENGIACNHAAATDADMVTVVNNLFHSMWRSVSFRLNGTIVETSDYYPYRAYLDTLTSFSKDVLRVRGSLQGWSKDTAGHMESYLENGENNGAKERRKMITSSRVFKMKGRLHSDLWLQGRSIPPGVSISLTLSPAHDKFVLLGANERKYEMHIVSAHLEVARQHTPASLANAAEILRKNGRLAFNLRRVKVVVHNIKAGLSEETIPKLFYSETALPDRFFAFCVSNNALSGDYGKNPFNFKHFSIESIYAKLNTLTIPSLPHSPKFHIDTGTVDEYASLLEEFGSDEGNHAIDLTEEEFRNGYTIFPFRVVSRAADGELLAPPVIGNIQLFLKFREPPAENVSVVVIAEYRESLVLPSKENNSGAE